jgi:hypothetical protein
MEIKKVMVNNRRLFRVIFILLALPLFDIFCRMPPSGDVLRNFRSVH